MRIIFVTLLLVFAGTLYSQPLITEDRKFLKVSTDVIKQEHDFYLPALPGKQITRFVKWEYEYKNGRPTAERSFTAGNKLWTEQWFEYNQEGWLIKDSAYDPSFPKFDYTSNYEYDDKGRLSKVTWVNKMSGKTDRVDSYKKYKGENTYQKLSEFFGDDTKIKYTSVFENGLKQKVIHQNGFPPVVYEYDSTGLLTAINSKKYFYKLDERGNPVAAVAIERGMRTYHFIRLTYADGLITGSLVPDEAFMQKWNTNK